MNFPYVSLETHQNVAVIKIRIHNKYKYYPLTKNGCLEAGRYLFETGTESWLYSSSVDFPKEIKKRFPWDVRELIDQGCQEALEESEKPRKELIKMILSWCEKPDFQKKLTKTQRKLFLSLKNG